MEKKKTWRIFSYVITFILVAGLCTALSLVLVRQKQYQNQLENIYEKSYYNTMDSVGNIETKLTKLSVVEGTSLQKVLLNDIWRECELASNNIAQLNSKSESIDEIIKFINQMGDYCYYLGAKENYNLTEEETQNLEKFSEIIGEIRQSLQEVQSKIMEGDTILGNFNKDLNHFTETFCCINHASIDYPELIYDGPFSDGLNDREAKALKDLEELNVETAQEKLLEYFDSDRTTAKSLGEGEGNIPTFLFEMKINDDEAYAQVTKQGAKLIMYNNYREIETPKLNEEECVDKAKDFLNKIGYEEMENVWVTNNNSTVYINFAFVQDNIIIYPDLIKIKIAADNGDVIGFEAQNYIYNHTEREIDTPESLNYKVKENLEILEDNYALIPTEWNEEVLTIEFVCKKEEVIYYIYVNTETNEEERVLVVIDDQGKKLI